MNRDHNNKKLTISISMIAISDIAEHQQKGIRLPICEQNWGIKG